MKEIYKYQITLNTYRNLGMNGREQVKILTNSKMPPTCKQFELITGVCNNDYGRKHEKRELIVNPEEIVLIEIGEYTSDIFGS